MFALHTHVVVLNQHVYLIAIIETFVSLATSKVDQWSVCLASCKALIIHLLSVLSSHTDISVYSPNMCIRQTCFLFVKILLLTTISHLGFDFLNIRNCLRTHICRNDGGMTKFDKGHLLQKSILV